MHKLLALTVGLVIGMAISIAQAQDQDSETGFALDTEVSVFTDYMWRGFNLYDDMSLQPSVTASYVTENMGTFSLNGWMHVSMDQDEEQNEFTEYDLTPGYEITFDKLTLGGGFIFYFYNDEDEEALPETSEVYATVSYDTILAPTFSFYHDYDEFDYEYYELGFSHTFDGADTGMGDGFNITPSITLGFGDSAEKVYADDSGIVQITYGVSMDAPLGNMTVTPGIYFTQAEDDALEDEWWGGFTLAYSF